MFSPTLSLSGCDEMSEAVCVCETSTYSAERQNEREKEGKSFKLQTL